LCPIQFSFSVDICLLSAENRNISQPVNWDNCKKDEFVEYLTVNKDNEIKSIVNRLDDMLLLQDVSINDVNEVVKKVRNIFKHTSASVFGNKCKNVIL
jgi:signal recognition particle GTPase